MPTPGLESDNVDQTLCLTDHHAFPWDYRIVFHLVLKALLSLQALMMDNCLHSQHSLIYSITCTIKSCSVLRAINQIVNPRQTLLPSIASIDNLVCHPQHAGSLWFTHLVYLCTLYSFETKISH